MMKPRNGVAYGIKSTFLSLDKIILSLLSIASIALALSYMNSNINFKKIITFH
jgi:hypothetical protein